MSVSNERLAMALEAAAEFAVADERYLPLYERLEREVMERRSRRDILERAKLVARGAPQAVLHRVHH